MMVLLFSGDPHVCLMEVLISQNTLADAEVTTRERKGHAGERRLAATRSKEIWFYSSMIIMGS